MLPTHPASDCFRNLEDIRVGYVVLPCHAGSCSTSDSDYCYVM